MKLYVRFSHNQVGMLAEASTDGQNWHVVDLYKYYPTLDTQAQENRFIAIAEEKGFDVVRVEAVR